MVLKTEEEEPHSKSVESARLDTDFDEVWNRWVAYRMTFDCIAKLPQFQELGGSIEVLKVIEMYWVLKDLIFWEAEKLGDLYSEFA